MNFRIKQALLAAGIASTMALPMTSQASDGTISFQGAVTASTCTIDVNGTGSTDATVLLPTVDASSLSNADVTHKSSTGTFFNIKLSGCIGETDIGATPVAATKVQIYFEAGPNVDEATGGLINTAATSPSNVEVNLYNASGSTVVGTQIMPGTGTNQPLVQTIGSEGTQWFYAGYSTAGANTAASAGAVSTSITYSLVYN